MWQGQYFGPRFGVNDTVGCGVRRDQRGGRSVVFFTHNGKRIARTFLTNSVAQPMPLFRC